MQRLRSALAALTVSMARLPLLALSSLRAAERLSCWMNDSQQTCVITPWGKGGFRNRISVASGS
ncbi:MAG: hypothetical protein ACKO0M_04140 [Cyanobium sp.]